MTTTRLTLAGAALAACMGFAGAAAAQQFITIGTGGVTGVYYRAGEAICRLVNQGRPDHGVRCSVETTGGSVFNIRAIRENELDFGVVQSDVQAAAVLGAGAFEADTPDDALRTLFSLHPEPLHVMVRAGAGIASVADMAGHRVNVGNPGSGTRVVADMLLAANGIGLDDLDEAAELESSEQSVALCDGKIDAAIWAAGLPNRSTLEAASTCDITILDLTASNTGKVLAENPAYAAATIPGGMYPGNPADIATWGPKATLVTSADTPDEVVYVLVKAIFDNLDIFKTLHPAFESLTEERMLEDGLSAPLHPGAARYFEERGWM